LLKDAKQTAAAFKLLNQAIEQAPDDADVLYEQAMLAEKLGRFAEMERSLRRVIEIEPNNAHAHNALGYSLADRNERLPQAKELIEKALGLLPNDPFILDSLGWVEFRLGNTAEAVRLLRNAMQLRADAEIAAHLGEVLWFMGEREEALRILRQAHTLQPDSETLQSTLQRLGIRL
jgi:Flp pilus assembly protein TadD